ncbi:hypothetical protein V6N12_044415 [Hibiscus sabdariffa]|uniref:Uncharacterized protein n=1 Tax=Hibiscus sabdariffa TaxID=183260 RepID=A0ABR2AHM8_9ROSI
MKSTFAFGRFESMWDALNAVDNAHNRLMDGFKVRVSLDKKILVEHLANAGDGGATMKRLYKGTGFSKVLDGRSFKEVLMGNQRQTGIEDMKRVSKTQPATMEEFKAERSMMFEPLSIAIGEKEKGWLRKCFVGQISTMYDSDFMQQVLTS